MEFLFQPGVYATGSTGDTTLLEMLERMWLCEHRAGDGAFYLISGFANYNGGLRFYPTFREHTERGGRIVAVISGSATRQLSSLQVAEALLDCGADLFVVNRKRLLHAKCYGTAKEHGQELIVTSGNFTGSGVAQNAESTIKLTQNEVAAMGFSWEQLLGNIFAQGWDIYNLKKADRKRKRSPGWALLYDEVREAGTLETEL